MTKKLHFVITGRNEVVAKIMFLHLFVILFTGGGCGVCIPACIAGGTPACLAAGLQGGCVSQHALQAVSQHALQQVSGGCVIPACIAGGIPACPCSRSLGRGGCVRGIWSMSGRYASYWNAFLLENKHGLGKPNASVILMVKIYITQG